MSVTPAFASPRMKQAQKFIKMCPGARAGGSLLQARIPMKVSENGEWAARNERMFVWDGEWLHAEDNALTFDDRANILTQLTSEIEDDEVVGYTRTVNTYDENGMVIERVVDASLDGVNFRPSTKRVVAYDPVLTDVIISNEQSVWNGDEEMPGNCYHFDITRDGQGNITLAERAVLFGGVYDPTERFALEYGEDGKAVAATQSQLTVDYGTGELYWKEVMKLTDIKWVETDGQSYCVDSMMGGTNKMESATIVDGEEGMDLLLNISYSDDGGYTMTIVLAEDPALVSKTVVTPLPYGGSKTVTTEEYDGEVYYIEAQLMEYAPNGLIIHEYYTVEEGDYLYVEESKGEFYGDNEQQPEAYEYSIFDQETQEWQPFMRIEFSDYVFIENGSGVAVTASGEDAQPEYYNLLGMRLINPEKGTVCIERRGSRARKVIFR